MLSFMIFKQSSPSSEVPSHPDPIRGEISWLFSLLGDLLARRFIRSTHTLWTNQRSTQVSTPLCGPSNSKQTWHKTTIGPGRSWSVTRSWKLAASRRPKNFCRPTETSCRLGSPEQSTVAVSEWLWRVRRYQAVHKWCYPWEPSI